MPEEVIGNSVIITAQNQFSEGLFVEFRGFVTLTGTWVATITLQLKLQGTSIWIDIDSVTSNGRYYFEAGRDMWRIGCKTGGYTSGTCTAKIQGET